jgi:hypothetical protein
MSDAPAGYVQTQFDTTQLASGADSDNGQSSSGFLSSTHGIATSVTLATTSLLIFLERRTLFSWRGVSSAQSLQLFLLSVLYVDILSGLLHITLDNPTITHWPLIGPECVAFQGHHVTPNDIVRTTWAKHLSEAHFVHMILNVPMLFNLGCSPLRLWGVYANLNGVLMMAAHRW